MRKTKETINFNKAIFKELNDLHKEINNLQSYVKMLEFKLDLKNILENSNINQESKTKIIETISNQHD